MYKTAFSKKQLKNRLRCVFLMLCEAPLACSTINSHVAKIIGIRELVSLVRMYKICLEADETPSIGLARLPGPVAVTLVLPMLMEEATAEKEQALIIVWTIRGLTRFTMGDHWHQSTFLYLRYHSMGN